MVRSLESVVVVVVAVDEVDSTPRFLSDEFLNNLLIRANSILL